MSTVKANFFLDSAGGNTATINGAYIRPGVLDPENRIINGAFDFWQRGTSFTTLVYGADRWINTVVGGTVTMSRQAFTIGDTLGSNNPTFFLRQSVSGQSLASHVANVTQRIEGVRIYAGQTITLLGWARRSSGSGNMAVDGFQLFGTGGSPSAVVNLTPQTITLTGSWAPFAVTFSVPSVSGKTLGTNGDDYLAVRFWTSAGSDFNAFTNSLGLQTIGVDLWGIHIKLGSHTTAAVDLYKQPELGPELARCQRYCEIGQYAYRGYQLAGSNAGSLQPFAVTKRGQPSVTTSNVTNTNFSNATLGAVAVGATGGVLHTGLVNATGIAVLICDFVADSEL